MCLASELARQLWVSCQPVEQGQEKEKVQGKEQEKEQGREQEKVQGK